MPGRGWTPKQPSTAASASDRSALDKASAPPVEPSSTSEPWSKNFHELAPYEQMQEIVHHLKKLRAEVATLRAELGEHKEEPEQQHTGSRGDMTGQG